jgi:hypothetical protein
MTEPSALELADNIQRAWNVEPTPFNRAAVAARVALDALRAAPASEPVAWQSAREAAIEECAKLIESGAGMADLINQEELDQQAKYIRDLAALPSSPAPATNSLNSGESEPSVMPAYGAGETIFSECAGIALEHAGAWGEYHKPGYDDACNDIAEAIKLRASNRKTMDALAKDVRS